jgi:hypothetical protein
MSVDVLASLDSRRHQQGVHLVGASLAISQQAFHNFASAVTASPSIAY